MFGNFLKSALIAPVSAMLLMMAAPVSAPAAERDRDGVFSHQSQSTGQQDRWRDRRDGRRQQSTAWRDDRRDDRRDRWGDRRGDRREARLDRRDDRRGSWHQRRDRRQAWWQDRWRRHWDRWDRRAALRRHLHPHGHQWHPHRY